MFATFAPRTGDGLARALVLRAGAFAALWWLISEGAAGSWLIGVPAVLAAAWVSLRLAPPSRDTGVSIAGLPRFALLFVRQSLQGGVDVSRRVLARRMRIAPGFMDYRPTLPDGPARVFLVACISLLPGTLSVAQRGDRIEIHVLDRAVSVDGDLEALERAIAGIFRLPERPSHA